jgi:hypothetical protein
MTAPTGQQVNDAVNAWHSGAGCGMELHEYLGWTWDEYVLWVRDAGEIPARPLASTVEGNEGEEA